jgi:hypothetical protein
MAPPFFFGRGKDPRNLTQFSKECLSLEFPDTADLSPSSIADVKNAWSYTSIPLTLLHDVVLC